MRAERRREEEAEKRAANERRYAERSLDPKRLAALQALVNTLPPLPTPPLPNPADELARQIAEFLVGCPDITIADLRAALNRRFGAE